MRVLGIETSCDETGIAVYDEYKGLLAHEVYSQTDIHVPYGGVVPELASRDHIKKTVPMIRALLDSAHMTMADIDGIAYTAGPGLVGALMVGASVGHSIAWALGKPAIGIHHMEGHLLAPLLDDATIQFPFVGLLVSGGHTQLVEATGIGNYRLLGESVDDAVGEAFDKLAKQMGLGYPGGPKIATLAEHGNPRRFRFPRPMTDRPGLDFSFSGLKTFAVNTLQAHHANAEDKADIARAFEDAAVDTLVIKCKKALLQSNISRLVVAGGVSANKRLRTQLQESISEIGGCVHFPRLEFCTDNGAMIAHAGLLRLKQKQNRAPQFNVYARWQLTDLEQI